jgi:uncharacterized repeat protein (TIGR01451 family)
LKVIDDFGDDDIDYTTVEITDEGIPSLALHKVVQVPEQGEYVNVLVGESARFWVSVENNGDFDLEDIVVYDYLPPGLMFNESAGVDFSATGLTYDPPTIVSPNGRTITWEIGEYDLPTETWLHIYFWVDVVEHGEHINSAYVDAYSNGIPISDDDMATIYGYYDGENLPPDVPTNPSPEDGSPYEDVYDTYLECLVTDPNLDMMDVHFYWGDGTYIGTVYDVEHGTVASLYLPDYIDPDWLEHDTDYDWYVIVEDEYGATRTGPVWDFHTCMAWDLNVDKFTDPIDISIMLLHIDEIVDPAGSLPWDIDNDGYANPIDLSEILLHMDESY